MATDRHSPTHPHTSRQHARSHLLACQSDSDDGFVRFEHKNVDAVEEQVYEHMDRTLQYRVHIGALSNLPRRARKFSHMYVRYSFFRAGVTQTAPIAVHDSSDTVHFDHERRLAVDVTDAFVKYVASTNLTLEVPDVSCDWR